MHGSSVHHKPKTNSPPPAADQHPAPAQMRLDRRQHPRYLMSGRVTVMRRGHDVASYHQPVCSVQLCDVSDGGLAAHCDMPLRPDEPVAVFFPPRGPQRGVDIMGHVIRCQPDADNNGYRLALRFDCRPAA